MPFSTSSMHSSKRHEQVQVLAAHHCRSCTKNGSAQNCIISCRTLHPWQGGRVSEQLGASQCVAGELSTLTLSPQALLHCRKKKSGHRRSAHRCCLQNYLQTARPAQCVSPGRAGQLSLPGLPGSVMLELLLYSSLMQGNTKPRRMGLACPYPVTIARLQRGTPARSQASTQRAICALGRKTIGHRQHSSYKESAPPLELPPIRTCPLLFPLFAPFLSPILLFPLFPPLFEPPRSAPLLPPVTPDTPPRVPKEFAPPC